MHMTVLNLTLVNTCTCMSESIYERKLFMYTFTSSQVKAFFNVYLLTNGRGATHSPSC